jgi:integrase
VRPKVKVWTADNLGAFLDAIEGQRLYAMYHVAPFAGMRRGELCGISRDDVDLDAGRIIVRWQITATNYREARRAEKRGGPGRYRSKPKTPAGEARPVDLDADWVKALAAWRAQQQKEAEECRGRAAPRGQLGPGTRFPNKTPTICPEDVRLSMVWSPDRASGLRKLWSGRRESNSRSQFGRLKLYH